MDILAFHISTMNLILWGCVIWLPAFVGFVLNLETRFKNNLLLGVTVPEDAKQNPDIQMLIHAFRKDLILTCIFFTLAAIPCLLLSKPGITMTVWMIWLLLSIIIPYIPYTHYHKKLKQLKVAHGWPHNLEDDYWIWGQFYCNPNDSRFLINNRTGMNITVNLAKRSAQIFMGITILVVLAMPFLGVWMDKLDTTPVGLEITSEAIISTHTDAEYEVPLDSITYVEYVAEKPKLKRTAGTGMENVLKGLFSTPWGAASICVNPHALPYIYLETDDGKRYLFGSADSTETEAVYQQLMIEIQN